MSKQEEIRKEIARLTEDRFRFPAENAGLKWDANFNRMLANDILSYLHSQGVVIKASEQTIQVILPADGKDTGLKVPYHLSNLGFDNVVVVEPLVESETTVGTAESTVTDLPTSRS